MMISNPQQHTGGGQPPKSPLIPPPPSLSAAVWSLATPAEPLEEGLSTAMNIMTFATPVSVSASPYKRFMVSLYHGTRTKDYFQHCQQGVLQLLRPQHAPLVPILGKHSGYDTTYSKSSQCEQAGMPWISCPSPLSTTTTAPESSSFGTSFWKAGHHASESSHGDQGHGDDLWVLPYTDFHLLPECATYLHLQLCSNNPSEYSLEAHDHVVLLCNVVGVGTWNAATQEIDLVGQDDEPQSWDETNVLYTGALRKAGIL